MTHGHVPDLARYLGRLAEDGIAPLFDRLDLVDDFGLALIVGRPDARAEVAARFRERAGFAAHAPAWGILPELERVSGRAVAWVEGDDLAAWRPCLAALNEQRDRLRARVPVLLVLAGPVELAALIHDYPDLASVVASYLRLDEAPAAPIPSLRWLHLSDLHLTATARWERREPLNGLLRLVGDEPIRPHLVLVTGDVARSGKAAEYEQAEAFFARLMDALGLDARRHLFVVPGNHDVDRARIGPADAFLVEGLVRRAKAEDFEPEELARVLGDARAVDLLADRLEAFYAFTHRLLGPVRAWDPRQPWRSDAVEVDGQVVGVLGLNTAWACGTEDAPGGLLLGETQVREALAALPPAGLRIAMMHHPLSWLGDARSAGGVLRAPGGAHVLLHGHLHEAEAAGRVGPDGETIEIAAGAAYTGGRWPLGCCAVDLDGDRGSVTFYGWSREGRGFWHPDNARYEGARDGRWTFPLPGRAAGPPVEPAQQMEAWITRYRAAAAIYHAQVSFIGLSTRGNAPRKNDVGDLFVPLLAGDRAEGEGGLDPAALARFLGERDGGGRAPRVVLLGDPGSGKTTLTRALAVWAAGGMALGDLAPAPGRVPLRIPFREYAADLGRYESDCLLDFLVRQAGAALDLPRDKAFFEGVLREGRALVLLDGLDEVCRPDQREETVRGVRVFAETWPRSPMLVTSRVVGYSDAPLPGEAQPMEADRPRPFRHLVVRPLADDAIDLLVERWYAAKEPADRRLRQEMTADLLGALAAIPRVRELARNPLLATLICVVHGHRARLPGERVKLYEELVETLLDTWVTAKRGVEGFLDLDPGRQRRYLEGLALEMQREREKSGSEEAGVLVRADALVALLVKLAAEPGADPVVLRRTMDRWVAWLAARTGLLVEQRPGWYGFLHLTLQEYLAACALEAEAGAGGTGALVAKIEELAESRVWRETVSLLIGRRADDRGFAEALAERMARHGALRDVVLAAGLREELDLPGEMRAALVRRALVSPAAYPRDETLDSLAFVARHSPRHRAAVRREVVEALLARTDGGGIGGALASRLSALCGDRLREVALRLRRLTRDGDALWWLWHHLEPEVGAGWFFDHVPAADRERALGLMEPWWRVIPAGSFLMGSPEENEPQHVVTILAPFRMLGVPVTRAMYGCLDPSFERNDDHPVTGVSWYAATTFARWLGCRLPREEEWEYACRAGTTTRYWSGDSEADLDRVGWYAGNSGGNTHPVAEKAANPWGLFDVHGNVREWCADPRTPYAADPLVVDSSVPPDPPLPGGWRANRGGSWHASEVQARSAYRGVYYVDTPFNVDHGFRLVAPLPAGEMACK